MIRSAFVNKVLDVIGDDSTESEVQDNLNWAQLQIAKDFIALGMPLDELMTLEDDDTTDISITVADTKTYDFPSDYLWCYSIRLIDGTSSRILERVLPIEMDTKIPYPEDLATGRSKYWIPRGTQFEIYPIPDDAYSLYIYY